MDLEAFSPPAVMAALTLMDPGAYSPPVPFSLDGDFVSLGAVLSLDDFLSPGVHDDLQLAGSGDGGLGLTGFGADVLVIRTACHHIITDMQSMSFFILHRVGHCCEYWLNRPVAPHHEQHCHRCALQPTCTVDHRNIEFMGDLRSSLSCPVVTQDRIKNLVIHLMKEFVVRRRVSPTAHEKQSPYFYV
ncbi:hypothetical protein PR202_ga00087 [Eleusine coracana subsp. coracana]|uniref:Uncharacterized protein n=1 Tax=Eleusine coracana subsp. coracana TaxID=191504 RepID=A0AAV5BAX9_ELECO|nr:hypothetical protein PR202_ga00087 [Eleusine coracana subsp. coracana]